jgi:hypothetical protein
LSAADEADLSALPACGEQEAADRGQVVSPWHTVLDEDGAVIGHRLMLRRGGADTTLRTGRRGFALTLGHDRLVIGERGGDSTRLTMIDTRLGCRAWTHTVEGLAYPEWDSDRGGKLRFTTHDPATGSYEGSTLVEVETGASGGLIDGECIDTCTPNDGGVSPAALQPPGPPRPTPSFAAGGWPKDTTLSFRWGSGTVPPAWAQAPVKAAAVDATGTSQARSPRFSYASGATNAVAYTGHTPSYCSSSALACAGRSMPGFWGVWLRPQGTDYAWGTLRWCQKTSSSSGCFDMRRVVLHELGHITGLNHPSSAGFTLSSGDSVMQAITPQRPEPGASQHAFGRCDVATLQELYDSTDSRTAISTCNDVTTTLALSSSKSTVLAGRAVTLTAQLRIAGWAAFGRLADNPLDGRSVRLMYRRAGTGGGWNTAWMRSLSSGLYDLTITPSATWEFKAVFPTPAGEGLRDSHSQIVKVKVKR